LTSRDTTLCLPTGSANGHDFVKGFGWLRLGRAFAAPAHKLREVPDAPASGSERRSATGSRAENIWIHKNLTGGEENSAWVKHRICFAMLSGLYSAL
jgi:hypothetical protein